MGLAATPQTSGYAVPTSGLAIRKFVCIYFQAYKHSSGSFEIFPQIWVAADLMDLTGTSVTATTFPVSGSAQQKTTVNLVSGGKVREWFKLSNGGDTSDAYNLKEDWWVPLNTFSFDSTRPPAYIVPADGVHGVEPSLLRRIWARLARRP